MPKEQQDTLKQQLKSAFPAQRVPRELEERMLRREEAVTVGRRAETALRRGESSDTLMADAMLGRLARLTELPAARQEVRQSLLRSEGFRAYRRQSMEKQLSGLCGNFIKDIAPQKKTGAAPVQRSEKKPEAGRGRAL